MKSVSRRPRGSAVSSRALTTFSSCGPPGRPGHSRAKSVWAAAGERADRSRRVGGRVFVWRDSTWTDIAHGDSLRVITVAAFSDAYFTLLRALPELVQPATLEPAVLVAGRRTSIKIAASGKTEWASGELATLVSDFRQ